MSESIFPAKPPTHQKVFFIDLPSCSINFKIQFLLHVFFVPSNPVSAHQYTLRLVILLPFSNRAGKPSLNNHFLLCFPSFYFFFLLISPFFPAKKSKKIESHFSPGSLSTSSFFPSRKHPLIECFLILQAELIYWAIVDKQYIGQHREGKKYNKYK